MSMFREKSKLYRSRPPEITHPQRTLKHSIVKGLWVVNLFIGARKNDESTVAQNG
jgi:hypothetical protein